MTQGCEHTSSGYLSNILQKRKKEKKEKKRSKNKKKKKRIFPSCKALLLYQPMRLFKRVRAQKKEKNPTNQVIDDLTDGGLSIILIDQFIIGWKRKCEAY